MGGTLHLWAAVALLALQWGHCSAFEHHTMAELVLGQGYPLEEHFVTTSDGYVLGVYRIPHGRPWSAAAAPRPPVLLQHGLLDSSATWVVNNRERSLGFILADAGYDVWLSNSRGNAFSRNHTGIPPTTPAFWDFSFSEMAAYDLPAVVDYVLAHSGTDSGTRLAYVGHSQGGTVALAALSESAALRERVSVAVLLAPAVFMAHVGSVPLLALARLQADQLFNLVGAEEFLPSRRVMSDLFGEICTASPLLCLSVLTAICGFNADNLDTAALPRYVTYAPSGTSVRNMAHWAQAVRKAGQGGDQRFARYDYGDVCVTPTGQPRTCNMRVYRSRVPPAYNLSAITTPLALFWGVQDKLADPVDGTSLEEALPPGVLAYSHSEPSYEHLDFVWGENAADRIYPAVLRMLSGGGEEVLLLRARRQVAS